MAVELPEPLQWVLLLLAGSRWPEGDEDLMRDMGRRWRASAETLDEAGRAADSAVRRALDGQQGSAAEALEKDWNKLVLPADGEKPGFFPGMVKSCNAMADSLEAMANSTETAKISIVAQLGILAFEIATAEAAAPVTAGASLATIPAAVTVSRTVVQTVLKKLAKEIIEYALKEAFQEVAINLLAQSIQLAAGNRKELDGKELGMSAAGGAIGGAAGGLIGKGLGAAGGKLIGKKMDTLPTQMVEGGLTDVGADVVTQLALTGEVDGSGLGGSALSGAGSPAIMHGASALKGKFNSSDIPDASDFAGGSDTPGSGSSNGSGSAGSHAGSNGTATPGSGGDADPETRIRRPDPDSNGADHPTIGGDADPETRVRRPDPDSNGADTPPRFSGGDADPETRVRTPAGDSSDRSAPRSAPDQSDAPRTFATSRSAGSDVTSSVEASPYQGPTAGHSEASAPRSTLVPFEAPAARTPEVAASPIWSDNTNSRSPEPTSTATPPPEHGRDSTSHGEVPASRVEAPISRSEPVQHQSVATSDTPSVQSETTASRVEAPTSRSEPVQHQSVATSDTSSVQSETTASRAEMPTPRSESVQHQSVPTSDTPSGRHESSGTPVSSGPSVRGGAPATSDGGAPHLDGIRLASGPAPTRGPSSEGTTGVLDGPSTVPVRGADSPTPAANNTGGGTAPPMMPAGSFGSGPVHSGGRGVESHQAPSTRADSVAGKPARGSAFASDPGAGLRLGPARPRPERSGTGPNTPTGTGGRPTPDEARTPTHNGDGAAPAPAPQVGMPRPATDGRPSGGDGGLAEPTARDHERIEQAVPRNADGTPQRHPDPGAGDWLTAINGDGPGTPGRNNNCVDTTLAVLDTFHGNPTPAAARTPDLDAEGRPSDLGERDGRDRMEKNLGARFSDLGDGPAAFHRLEQTLRRTGHGSAAAITTVDADGRSHSWTALNTNGTVTYVDGQTGKSSNQPLHNGDNGVFAIPLDPDRQPAIPEPHADPNHNPANDRRAPERPAADTTRQDPGVEGNQSVVQPSSGAADGAGRPEPAEVRDPAAVPDSAVDDQMYDGLRELMEGVDGNESDVTPERPAVDGPEPVEVPAEKVDPVPDSTADDQMYDGLREFMEGVDSDAAPEQPVADTAGQDPEVEGNRSVVPPSSDRARGPEPREGGEPVEVPADKAAAVPVSAVDDQMYDGLREFMEGVDGNESDGSDQQRPPAAPLAPPLAGQDSGQKADGDRHDEGSSESTPPPKTPEGSKPADDDVPSPAEQTAPGGDFPPFGARVAVPKNGYCLIHSLIRSVPGLGGAEAGGHGNEADVRRLQAAVEHHFSEMPPERVPIEVVSNYRNGRVGLVNPSREQLLNHLPAEFRASHATSPTPELEQAVGDYLAQSTPPVSKEEKAALLETVRAWNSRWSSDAGEMLPAAAAHALGLRLQVVDHNGVPFVHYGPSDGQPVTVYRQADHYDGSNPVITTPVITTPAGTTPAGTHPAAATPVAPKDVPSKQEGAKPVPPKDGAEQEGAKPVPPKDGAEQEGDKPEAKSEAEPPPAHPAAEAEPLPQEAVGPRPIAGNDLVLGLTKNEAAVRDKVIEVLEAASPGDRAAARAFADAHFGPATLRPMLSALSRGEVWTAPFDANGWSGGIKLRGQVTGSTHLRTEKIEIENGADRIVAVGTGRDAQWQYNIGVQARQSGAGAEAAELAGYFHDRGHGEVNLDLGGMVARSKTSEPADVFDTTMKLEIDFSDLRHDHQPVNTGSDGRTEKVDLSLNVAVPVRPDGDSVGELRTPPKRLLDGRVGGQEIVLDLSPHGGSHDQRPVEALLGQVEQAAEQEFGKDWPAMREKVLAEVDLARLQRDLKSMTAGEPTTVTLTDRRGKSIGTVEISARVGALHQTGTTKETEFNIGTTVQQVRSTATNRGNAGQLGGAGVLRPGAALFGIGGAGRLGRDRIEIAGDSRTAQLTSKSKVPGVRYEGPVHFEMTFNGKGDPRPAGTADVKLLVDRADTSSPEAVKPAPEQETPEAGRPESTTPDLTPEPAGTDESAAPPTHEVISPPESVWQGGNDRGGLDETVVVRDLDSTAALRAAVDAQGRAKFGKDWDAVRGQVLQGFSQPNLAAKLTGMTRGEPLEVKIPGKENLVVTAVARVESMTYHREDGKAELNTVNETGAFSVDRQLLARTIAANGQFGGTVAKATPGLPGADLFGNVNGQQRDRAGGQGRQADRVYANGKYSAPQVIYGAELMVDLFVGRPGETGGGKSDASAALKVEVSLDARDTVKVQAPRSENGAIAFKRPTEPAGATPPARTDQSDPAGPKPVDPDRPATHTAPRRMREQHELNASYVVHSLGGADKVHTAVADALRDKYGEPSPEVKQKIDATFDRVALKTQLSQLTRGGKITETVSGTTWKAEVTVTARLAKATYHSTADKYEFESGTRTSRGQGNMRDHRERFNGGGLLRMKAPFVDVAGGYTYRMDRSYGHGAETVGSASNRGKHVEPAAFFDVDTAYDVKVTYTRLGVNDGSHTETVDTVARVAVPMRDVDPVAGPVERTTSKQPKGFVEGRRLDSSAIVTDVHPLPDAAQGTTNGKAGAKPRPRQTLGESILSQVESGRTPGALRPTTGKAAGRPKADNPFGSDRAGIHRKLDAELTPDRLQSRLKGMTAGDEIVVRHGRTTVRVGAVLRDRMEHLGETGTTEFNTGTDVQRSFADADGTGHGHQGLLGVTTSVPVPSTPVSVTGGVTGTGGRGQDHADVRNTSTSAGSATKAKVPGSAYRGEAELQFTITRRPLVGASVHQRRTAAIGFETIVESGETVPVVPKRPDDAAPPAQPPRTLPVEAPAPAEVRIPPERVWQDGLRDSDVLRFLGDVGGIQDLARLRGPQFFGRSNWEDMAPIVGTVTSHSHLSALFGTATQGTEASATVPTKRVTLGGGKGVEVGVKIVSLEHRDNDSAVESSPSNSTSAGTVHSDLSAKNAGVQAQAGARITGDVTNNPAITGGAQRFWREGGTQGDAGQIVSNGKFPTPMARYSGAAEVEVTFFDGKREPVKETGVVPFTVDIPLADTTKVDLPGDHYLAFTEKHQGGELRSGEEAGLLGDVHRTLTGGDRQFDHGTATPAAREQLMGTVRVGRAAFGEDFTSATEAGAAHIRATHRLVELSGGSSAATSALLGDLLGTPPGTALKADQLRQAVDFVQRKSADGPVTLDDLVAGAQDGWPADEPYEIHREAWTDHGPANELVTAAMADAAAAARPLLQGGLPAGGRLYLTVSGEGSELPLRREFELSGDPEEQIRTIEEATYLKPGTRPSEVGVRLAGASEGGQDWDFRITARPEGSRELTLRHRLPAAGQQPDEQVRTATAANVTAAGTFAAGRTAVPAESG